MSKKYQNTVQALRPYAEKFDLRSDLVVNADMASSETIVKQWFTNWTTCNRHVARRLGLIAYCLKFSGKAPGHNLTDEDLATLGEVHNLSLLFCIRITDVSALGGVHTLSLHGCNGITDVSALGGVHNLSLRYCRGITDLSGSQGDH